MLVEITKEKPQATAIGTSKIRMKTTKCVRSPKLAPAARASSRKPSRVLSAIVAYQDAQRSESKARAALKKLVAPCPELADCRPGVEAGIADGIMRFIRCRHDFEQIYGSIQARPDLWKKIEEEIENKRSAHNLARRRAGICRAEDTVYQACRARLRAFEKLVLQQPESREDIRAYGRQIVRELERDAVGTISNTYRTSDRAAVQQWQERRHYAMFLALRVLKRLAK